MELEADSVNWTVSVFKVFDHLEHSIWLYLIHTVHGTDRFVIVKEVSCWVSLVCPLEYLANVIIYLWPRVLLVIRTAIFSWYGFFEHIIGNRLPNVHFVPVYCCLNIVFEEGFNLTWIRFTCNSVRNPRLIAVGKSCKSKGHILVWSKLNQLITLLVGGTIHQNLNPIHFATSLGRHQIVLTRHDCSIHLIAPFTT